jgi:cobalt/nickel transport system permease protein
MNLKLISIISSLLETDQNSERTQSRIMPVVRLAVAVLCILLVALSRNMAFVEVILAAELVRLAMKPPAVVRAGVKRIIFPVLFTMLIMLPSVFLGHPKTMLTITIKVLTSLLVLVVLNADVEWREMTAALETLHMPGLFIMTIDMTVRFLAVLGRYANSMIEAVNLRTVTDKNNMSNDKRRLASAGGVMGTTFLVSQRMQGEMAEAMECRGFTGQYRSYSRRKFKGIDAAYLLIAPVLIALYWYLASVV